AGNAGPNAGTISGNYKKAPWVVTVAAGTKTRQLAAFSSRGVKDKTVTVRGSDGVTYTSEDRPTVTAPGVGIVSARAAGSSLTPLSAPADLSIEPTALPYYTTMDGTSMAAPHVAGIAALMLDMNPALRPYDIKQYLQQSADPVPGYEPWQVGAGYVNAYNAVLQSIPVNPVGASQSTTANARVTVAVIDSAINPYHDFYNAGGEPYRDAAPSSVTPEVLAAFGIDEAHQIQLTRTGNFANDYAADKARVWDKIRPGELYWFKGTNVIAASYAGGTRPILPDDSADTHGVGTSSAVLRANPEAIVVFLEGITSEAESFAFRHPEIDIITTSYGAVGSLPLPNHINDSYVGVVFNGKLHFGAADNSPSPAVQDGTAGPWWSVGDAGFQEATHGTTPADPGSNGRQIVSGSLPDFVADFTQVLPYCFDCETGMQSASGTSFATPRSAGTMSKVLLETRRALGHAGGIGRTETGRPFMAGNSARRVTNWELRRALENGAYYPRVVDYTLTTSGTYNLTSVPVLDPTPWTQVGWGVITTDPTRQVVEQTLAHLGIRYAVTRNKDYLACQYMTTLIRARQVYWNAVALESQSRLNFNDPYVYCGQ
ncbi:MAG TPA: S8 family serine peptidase, partial [Pyrinomonadaceae bacterium]|nr:S8 family serine peptidase [Pyrinomonadaceae bacterium]